MSLTNLGTEMGGRCQVVLIEDTHGNIHTLSGTSEEIERKAIANGWIEPGWAGLAVQSIDFHDLTKGCCEETNEEEVTGWLVKDSGGRRHLLYGTLEAAKKKATESNWVGA